MVSLLSSLHALEEEIGRVYRMIKPIHGVGAKSNPAQVAQQVSKAELRAKIVAAP